MLNAIENGKSAGNGQMAGGLYTGEDAEDVANFVAKAVGSTEAPRGGRVGRLRGRVGRVVRRLSSDSVKVHFRTLHGRFREPPEQVLTYAPLR